MAEIVLERVGECLKCGACCYEGKCPHFDPATRLCGIYDERDKFCEVCGKTHDICIRWPVYPVQFAKPFCGYRFIERRTGHEVIRMEMVNRKGDVVT